jgi:hypothetical protein
MKRTLVLLLLLCVSVTISGIYAADESNMPLSNQASFVESYSPSEVTIKATGMGGKSGFFRNDMDKNAILDLRKAAVNFVLFLGTDPMLKTPEEKTKFESIQETFFANDNVNKYISWEADKVISSIKTTLPSKKDGVKITKMVRVNTKLLSDDMAAQGIMMSQSDLAGAIGNPFIMVIPDAPKGQSPLDVMDKNPLAKHTAAVIESYLTARKYDVQVPQAGDQLNEQIKMQAGVKGVEEDISYQLAMAIGCDVYIVYAGQVSPSGMGKKASLSCKAYETTTARLLGTETGYSQVRNSADEVLIEEAMNDAISKVLERLRSYWQDDLKKGLQYKLIFKLTGQFDEDQKTEIQDAVSDQIEEMCGKNFKENVITDKTLDYLIWAKKDEYGQASKIERKLRKELPAKVKGVKVNKININRKLIILEIKEGA